MSKKTKIGIVIIVIVALCLVIPYAFVSALWIEDAPVFETVPPLQAVEKVRQAQKQGGTVKLSEAEVNSLIELFVQKQEIIPYVKQVNVKLGEESVEIYAQGVYSAGIKFLLYSQGEMDYKDGRIVFTPEVWKAGRIPLPKGMILNMLAKKAVDKMLVADGSIAIEKSLLPLKFDSFVVMPGQMVIGFVQTEKQPPDVLPSVDEEQPSNEQPSNNQHNSNPQSATGDTQELPLSEPEDMEKVEPEDIEKVPPEEVNGLLSRVSSELSVVRGVVKSDKEKAIVSTMIGTVNQLMADPDYPYKDQAALVIGEYRKLTAEERTDLKMAMLNNMDITTALEVKNLFGL